MVMPDHSVDNDYVRGYHDRSVEKDNLALQAREPLH